jgi:lipopolysaccharide/colanic/teichoic acid biosynthesis glycosyltransferase
MEIRRFRIITLFADIAILTISFLLVVSTKPSSIRGYVPSHSLFFGILAVIWLIVSLINGKMHRGRIINFSSLFYRVISSNIIALSITALIMYSFREYSYSRTVVLGTALLATFLELLIGSAYIAYKKARVMDNDEYGWYTPTRIKKKTEHELVDNLNGNGNGGDDTQISDINPRVFNAIEKESGYEMASAVVNIAGTRLNDQTAVLSTTTIFNITNLPYERYDYIINLHKINDIKNLNAFLDEVNSKLLINGYFFCCVETKDQRKTRLLKKYPIILNYIYYFFDFLIKRVLPKLKFTRGLYILLTRDENKVLSRAEALGRLSRAGFMINQETFIGNTLCIEGLKIGNPIPMNGTNYGPLIALMRVGKEGEMLKVYKLRTMHPYSEYIQDYIYKQHDLLDGGKFRDDFRITSWGAFSRKIWMDEFPMLINFFKGNMKLVGVRPLSRHYFDLYNKSLQDRRIKYKPGLIPPFYADLPSDLDAIQESETRYLDKYDKHPILTDFTYFWKSVWNILFRYARSG